MRRLNCPANDPIEVYEACVAAVGDPALRQIYTDNQDHFEQGIAAFDAATAAVSWVTLPRVGRGNPGVVVAGTLTKKHLVSLYSDYMVGTKEASRKTYDDVFVAAGGFCPFCAGLGHVKTLDHYLPKANFPLYSVLPANLVPCCRDCNTGKNNTIGTVPSEQPLHPYLDDNKFFSERWVRAEVVRTNPISLKYICSPPAGWTNTDRLRVQQHFRDYKIGARFSLQAGAELSRVVDARARSLRVLTRDTYRDHLLDYAHCTEFDLNGWSRSMYAALAETNWFLETDFSDPDWHLLNDEDHLADP